MGGVLSSSQVSVLWTTWYGIVALVVTGIIMLVVLSVLVSATYKCTGLYEAKRRVQERLWHRGKVVLLIGGGSGIGAAQTQRYVELGARVVIVGRRLAKLQRTVAACDAIKPGRVLAVQGDTALQQDCKSVVAQAVEWGGKLDILMMNQAWGRIQLFDEIPEAELGQAISDTYDVNTRGAMFLVYYALPHVRATGGNICYNSSMTAYYGVPKTSLYSSSKAAMHNFFRAIRAEAVTTGRPHVNLLITCPGLVLTDHASQYISKRDLEPGMAPDKCAKLIVRQIMDGLEEVPMPMVDRIGKLPIPVPGYPVWFIATNFPRVFAWLFRKSYGYMDGGIRDAIEPHPITGQMGSDAKADFKAEDQVARRGSSPSSGKGMRKRRHSSTAGSGDVTAPAPVPTDPSAPEVTGPYDPDN